MNRCVRKEGSSFIKLERILEGEGRSEMDAKGNLNLIQDILNAGMLEDRAEVTGEGRLEMLEKEQKSQTEMGSEVWERS